MSNKLEQLHPRQVERITEEQARTAVQRFTNRHFNNPSEKSHASIPAAPDDDDILLMDYITQRERAVCSSDYQRGFEEAKEMAAQPLDIEIERQTFEEWWKSQHLASVHHSNLRRPIGDAKTAAYKIPFVQIQWLAWWTSAQRQAAIRALECKP